MNPVTLFNKLDIYNGVNIYKLFYSLLANLRSVTG